MSTTYHPRWNESTEMVNQCLEQYLRSRTSYNPKNWSFGLPAGEWWYNTTFHTTLQSTTFQGVHRTKAKNISWTTREHTNLQGVEDLLEERQQHIHSWEYWSTITKTDCSSIAHQWMFRVAWRYKSAKTTRIYDNGVLNETNWQSNCL